MKRIALAALLLCAGLSVGAERLAADVTMHVRHSFAGTDGANPIGGVIDGGDGFLYGTTSNGGSHQDVTNPAGTVFRITPAGSLESLYTFEFQVTGDEPWANLLRRADGTLFGITRGSGSYNGNVFELGSDGSGFTNVHGFAGTILGPDGGHPEAALADGGDGSVYGTTSDGGTQNAGTIYQIDGTGEYTMVHSFTGQQPPDNDDVSPRAALVPGDDGALYGTAGGGGVSGGHGTVFRYVPGDTHVTVIHRFSGSDGDGPNSALALDAQGVFYGTTGAGGDHGAGTVFRITESGDFASLHSFDYGDSANGANPIGVMVASDGNLYGTTSFGGTSGIGMLFRIQPNGQGFQPLFSFSSLNGAPYSPRAPMIQSGGNFYGTTYSGGAGSPGCPGGCGTVYEIDGSDILAPEPGAASCDAAMILGLVASMRRRRIRSAG
jgi:uncharacterized repeat protein (TIGR03803 family)